MNGPNTRLEYVSTLDNEYCYNDYEHLMLRRYITRYFLIYFLIAQVYILLSNLPFIIYLASIPPNSVYPLAHQELTGDYYSYLAYMTQGKNGAWLVRDPYTTEDTKPGIFHMFYLILGKLAGYLNIWMPTAYHIARIISTELLILCMYILSHLILGNSKSATISSIFALTATIAPLNFFSRWVDFRYYIEGMPWFINFDALRRLNAVPHHIFGQAAMLIGIIGLFKFSRGKNFHWLLIAIVIVLIGGLTFPPILAVFVMVTPLSLLLFQIRKLRQIKKLEIDRWMWIGCLFIIIAAVAVYFIILWQQTQGFPWSVPSSLELTMYNYRAGFDVEFFLVLGTATVFTLPGIFSALVSKKWILIYIVLWALLPIFVLPFSTMLGIPKHRLLQQFPFVPLGILAAHAMAKLKKHHRPRIFLILSAFVFVTLTIPTSLMLLAKRLDAWEYYFPARQFQIPKPIFESFLFFTTYAPKGSRILSTLSIGNLIPAFAPVVSFTGHPDITMGVMEKEKIVSAFFGKKMHEGDAREFLRSNRIDYVYQGESERELDPAPFTYPFLKETYKTEAVTIYKTDVK